MVDDGRIEDAKSMLALTICDRLRSDRSRHALEALASRRTRRPGPVPVAAWPQRPWKGILLGIKTES